RPHFVTDPLANLRLGRRDAVPVDDPGADLHHLLEQRPGLAGARLDHLAVLAVEQPEQRSWGSLHQAMDPRDAGVLALGVPFEIRLSIVSKLEKFEHAPVFAAGIGLEVIKYGDEAAIVPDEIEESLQVLPQESGLPIVEEAPLE